MGLLSPRANPDLVNLYNLVSENPPQTDRQRWAPVIGVDSLGSPVRLDLSVNPHTLFAGRSGSGKSIAVQTAVTSLALTNSPRDLAMFIIDPKRSPEMYSELGDLRIVRQMVYESQAAAVLLQNLVDIMEKRHRVATTEGRPKNAIVIVLDEWAELLAMSGRDTDNVMKPLTRLLQAGRSVNIFCLLSTQVPDAASVPQVVSTNVGNRVVGILHGQNQRTRALGTSERCKLLGKGDFLVRNGGVTRTQIAMAVADTSEKRIIHARLRKGVRSARSTS